VCQDRVFGTGVNVDVRDLWLYLGQGSGSAKSGIASRKHCEIRRRLRTQKPWRPAS
jgi:hypothetical protein